MGNEHPTRRWSQQHIPAEVDTRFTPHLGNSAYKVKLFVNTSVSGYAGKTVSCCDVRLTKLASGVHDHAYITRYLEAIMPDLSHVTPHICADCGDWKTYYKKCI
jgi:hypothetical protein